MSRDDILRILKEYKGKRKTDYGILAMGLFGSVARNQTGPDSDVDVVVQLEKQDLYYLIGIKQELEEILHTPVDVFSYREKMSGALKKRIEQEAFYV